MNPSTWLDSNWLLRFGFRVNSWLWGHCIAAAYLVSGLILLSLRLRVSVWWALVGVGIVGVLNECWELAWANRLFILFGMCPEWLWFRLPARIRRRVRKAYYGWTWPADAAWNNDGTLLITAKRRWIYDSIGDVAGMLLTALPTVLAVLIVAGCCG